MKRTNTRMKKITVLSTILLGCLLVITVQGDSSVQGKELGYKNKLGVSSQKEPIFVRSGAGYMRKLGLGGNKFSTQHEVTSVDSKNGEGETSKISGATYSDGICVFDEREGDAKIVKCKGEKSSIKPRKLKMDGFVAFTDDYHGPRHHIPKHN